MYYNNMTLKIWTILWCVSLAIYGEVSGEDVYGKVGDRRQFPADAELGSFKTISWKCNKNKVAEYDTDFSEDVSYYGNYKGRTKVDRATAMLTIDALRKDDNGDYTVEFDSKEPQKTYRLSVIDAVPKPRITKDCEMKTTCTLTCDGNTTGADPLTYSWRKDEAGWETLGQKMAFSKYTKYTCKLQNPVSEETSEPFKDLTDETPVGGIVAAAVVVPIAVALTAAVLWHRKKTGVWLPKKGAAGANGTHGPRDAGMLEEADKDGEKSEEKVSKEEDGLTGDDSHIAFQTRLSAGENTSL